MAEWSKNKVDPINLHGGQEFVKGDNLAVDELNAIVNNSFYASDKSTRAEQLAESAVKGNGTLVTIGGQIQGEWSADFAEAERQKSKNLCCLLDYSTSNAGLTITYDRRTQEVTINGSGGDADYSIARNLLPIIKNKAGKTFTVSLEYVSGTLTNSTYSDYVHVRWGSMDTRIWDNEYSITSMLSDIVNGKVSKTITLGNNETYDTLRYYIKSYTVANNFKFRVQIEEGEVATDYQLYNGAIVHEKQLNDKAVTLVDNIVLGDGYTKIDLSNIIFKAGVPYLIEVAGGVPSANDGKIYVNNLTSGYSILTELYNETAGSVATEQHHNHIPCRFDKMFTIKIFVKSVEYTNGSTTFITCENFSVPSNTVGGGKYVRNSRGVANAYPATSIQIQSDSAFWAGTNVKIYKYGE